MPTVHCCLCMCVVCGCVSMFTLSSTLCTDHLHMALEGSQPPGPWDHHQVHGHAAVYTLTQQLYTNPWLYMSQQTNHPSMLSQTKLLGIGYTFNVIHDATNHSTIINVNALDAGMGWGDGGWGWSGSPWISCGLSELL